MRCFKNLLFIFCRWKVGINFDCCVLNYVATLIANNIHQYRRIDKKKHVGRNTNLDVASVFIVFFFIVKIEKKNEEADLNIFQHISCATMYICWKIEIWLEFIEKCVLYTQFDDVVWRLWLTTITPHSILQYFNTIQSD